MRIAYLSQSRIPSDSANSIHVFKMCEALAQQGNEVTLLGYRGDADQSPFRYYHVNESFRLETFNVSERPGESLLLAIKSLFWLARHRKQLDLLYSRSAICLFLALSLHIPFVFEIHSIPRTKFHRWMEEKILAHRKKRKIVVISHKLKDWYLKAFPKSLDSDDVLVLPDASDEFRPTNSLARLKGNSKVKLGYIGHLYPGKGGELIVELAARMPQFDFHVVGGKKEDINRLKSSTTSKNLFFYGHKPYSDTKSYLQVFDIVLAPYAKQVRLAKTKADIGQWMSPLKIFEYMSAGKAMIASNLPVLQEVLHHNQNSLLAEPDDLDDWESKITQLATDKALRTKIEDEAYRAFVDNYTWAQRANRLIDAL